MHHHTTFCNETVQVGLHHRWGVPPPIRSWFPARNLLLVDLRGNDSWIPKPIFLLCFVKQGPQRSTSAPFPSQETSMTSSLPTFRKSQGLTLPPCTPSMVSNTASRPQTLPSTHGLVDCLQTGWLRPRTSFSKWKPWGSNVTQIVHGHPCYTWYPKLQVDGTLAGTIDVSMR